MSIFNREKLSVLQNNVQKWMGKFQRNRYVSAIAGGMMSILPILMVGSFADVLFSLNIDSYQDFLTQTGIGELFNIISTVTMDLLSVYVVLALSNSLAAELKVDKFMAMISSVMAFFLLTPLIIENGDFVGLNLEYTGSGGMIVAMLVSLSATRLFSIFYNNKHLTIKLPDSVPEFVSRTFISMLPIFLIAGIYAIINLLFTFTPYDNIHDTIIELIQIPLQGLGSSLPAALILVFFAEFLWFFGIHGTMATNAILFSIFYPFDVANLEAFSAGTALPFIVTMTFITNQKGPRALAYAILCIRCKSQQLKSLGKVGFIPAYFGISEPFKFGMPMVLNPIVFIPLTMGGTISVAATYFATYIGLIPAPNGIPVQTAGTPEFFRAFLLGGWRMVIWHVVQLVILLAVWYPFIKMMDKQKLAEEQQYAAENN
ncbi:permease IIC component [Tetragenococcus halophilus subsp. flandriensis]|uniref:PTS sugar transporter subunit IIC n=1 Tax=Tetragenococcus halophilus TaxID=51669 RepID=UPI0023E9D5DB|nr:PTS transporter subunit EIIC [Tetragenococcus halophilus]GMA09066.1 permease IIC component [Tetragenococcus halophilus subsp. flandriensis]